MGPGITVQPFGILKHMLNSRGSFILRYGCAVVSIAVATYLRLLLDPLLSNQFPFATIFFGVLVTAWLGGFGPALLASALGAISSIYFLIPPRASFGPKASNQYFGIALYLSVSFGIAVLGGIMRAAQRRAEASAQAVSHQAALIDQTHDAVLTCDWNGPITFWNHGAEQLYGILSAQAIGRVSHELLHTSVPGGVDALVKALEREGVWEGEIERSTGDGQRITVETRMILVREAARPYVLETSRDITVRRRTEEALREINAQLEARVRERTADLAQSNASIREREQRLAGIVNSAMDAIISVDSEQKIVLFNSAAEEMFRCDAAGVMGQPIDKLIPRQFRQQHGQRIRDFGQTGATLRSMRSLGTVTGLRADGEEFPVEASISQVEVAGQKVFTVILRDVTERKRAEEDLRSSEAKLQTIVENLTEGLAVSDLDGQLLHFNRVALDLHGFATLEECRRHLSEYADMFELSDMDGTALPMDQWPLARVLRGEKLSNLEVRIKRKQNGWERVFNYGGTLVHDVGGQPVMAVVTISDISERSKAEDEIRRLNEELEMRVASRTAQLEAVNQELEAFSYSVSHDLRAPLRHINGFSLALLEDYAERLDEAGQSYLRELRGASQEMAGLIDDLLQLARVTRTEMRREAVNLSAMARAIMNELQNMEAERAVIVDIAEELWVHGDKHLLQVMMKNLLGNAWKFTAKREQAEITFGQCPKDGEIYYFVRDNGAGFDMEYVGRLFGAFQRLHTAKEFDGTGIGLATVQRIVHRHGGRVRAEGEVNKGAMFYFTLADLEETSNGEESDSSGRR